MSYQPLARKYRPHTFEDLVGQEAVVRALGGGIKLGREPHTVIFSGVRGIGKTTLARIYAKALNCENGPTPDPCGVCQSCVAIAEGHHEDVLEIDGASNTSVEDVRSLRETIGYVPQRSRFKIYIIDEVHMLSNSAFNALLKTLEEPPAHVVFLFATTELAKIPQTIVGRCQTFYLNKFTHSDIYRRLAAILEKENISFEGAALNQVAKQGRGSMRDALTFLDTAIAVSESNLTMEGLQGILEGVDTGTGVALIESLIDRAADKVVASLEAIDTRGIDWKELIEELAIICRHTFIIKELGKDAIDAQLLGLAPQDIDALSTLADRSAPLDLNRLFRTLYQCSQDLTGAHIDRYLVENSLLEWCLDPGLPTVEELSALMNGKTPTAKGSAQARPAVKAPLPSTNSVGSNAAPSNAAATKASGTEIDSSTNSGLSLRDRLNGKVDTTEIVEANSKAASVAPIVSEPASVSEPTAAPEPAAASETAAVSELAAVSEPETASETAAASRPTTEMEAPAQLTKMLTATDERLPFPQSWRQMVDLWQQRKPLQARIFEETFAAEFNSESIVLAVNENTMAGRKLLNPEVQQKTITQIKLMFNFDGRLAVVKTDNVVQGAQVFEPNPEKLESTDPSGQQTVLDEKRQEKAELIARAKDELINDQITKAALDMFGGSITEVQVTNP